MDDRVHLGNMIGRGINRMVGGQNHRIVLLLWISYVDVVPSCLAAFMRNLPAKPDLPQPSSPVPALEYFDRRDSIHHRTACLTRAPDNSSSVLAQDTLQGAPGLPRQRPTLQA